MSERHRRASARDDFRRALGYIGDVIAEMMEATGRRSPRLAQLGGDHGPGWEKWMTRW